MRFVLPLLLLTACQPEPEVPGQVERTGTVIKTVNGVNVTEGMVDAELAALPPSQRDQIVAMGQTDLLKEQVVIGELLYQEAIKQKLHEDAEIKQGMKVAERKALIIAMIEKVAAERSTPEKVKAWYDDHAVQFSRPQVKARHILVKDVAEANALLAEVKADPSKFSEVARTKSVDAGSGKEGGDLGWFEKERMVPEFAGAAFAANKGDIIGPIQSKFGYHIIAVDDKRDAVPLADVEEKIKGQLKKEIIEGYFDELKTAATITDVGGTGGATVTPATDADKSPVQGTKLPGPPAGMQVAPATGEKK